MMNTGKAYTKKLTGILQNVFTRQKEHFSLVLIIILFIVSGVLPSCSTQNETPSVPIKLPEEFSRAGNAEVPDEWWKVFKDEQLNALIDTALESNFNLRTAWKRLRAAQAVVKRENSALYPSAEAYGQAETGEPISDFGNGNQFQTGLSAEYEIDLWGRVQAQVEAEEYRAQASYTEYQTAALSLSAEIVLTWYRLMESYQQLDIVQQQIENNEKMLKLIKKRFGNGQMSSVDILRQEQLLESTIEQRTYETARLKTLEHRLMVLMGKPPKHSLPYVVDSLPEIPPLPETGVPAKLLRRRPDVQSAYNLLLASDKDLAAAISNRYPRLSISASFYTAAENAGNLFQDWAYSLGGNLLAPLFYGGRLEAEADRVEALKAQQLNQYGQTVITAFREVEDALVREDQQGESIASLERQMQLSEQAYDQLKVGYFNGIANYLDLLTALDEHQQLKRNLLSARLILLEYRISLYRSLAGGFETGKENSNDDL